jgi:2-polyprenyl-3-methyl-5-hydroxy-6-metoxy-1,4-benzoquinol methylase
VAEKAPTPLISVADKHLFLYLRPRNILTMQQRHVNRQQYFDEQRESTQRYVFPYIMPHAAQKKRVLEVGCGDGGNLAPFLEAGYECWGVELLEASYRNAQTFYATHPKKEQLHLLHKNIYDVAPEELGGTFDIVFLRDVIEHIPSQERFMQHLRKFMSPGGLVFFAFPPWRMPFGGHQQVSSNRWACRTPYMHALPKPLYRFVLKLFGLSAGQISGLLSIKETGISIGRFRKIIRRQGYEVVKKTHWLINPNYHVKFGLTPRRIPAILRLPYVQDFYTTAVYYLLRQKK